jgi:hypothetical protein
MPGRPLQELIHAIKEPPPLAVTAVPRGSFASWPHAASRRYTEPVPQTGHHRDTFEQLPCAGQNPASARTRTGVFSVELALLRSHEPLPGF